MVACGVVRSGSEGMLLMLHLYYSCFIGIPGEEEKKVWGRA